MSNFFYSNDLQFQIPVRPRRHVDIPCNWMYGNQLGSFLNHLSNANLYNPNKSGPLVLRILFGPTSNIQYMDVNDTDGHDPTGGLFFGSDDDQSHGTIQSPSALPSLLQDTNLPISHSQSMCASANLSSQSPVNNLHTSHLHHLSTTSPTPQHPEHGILVSATPDPPSLLAATSYPVPAPYRPRYRPRAGTIGRNYNLVDCEVVAFTQVRTTKAGDIRTFTVDHSDKPEIISIAQNWITDRDAGLEPSQGSSYLGKGKIKFGVVVSQI